MTVRQMLVAGRYRLLEPVGAGGMGRVWLARDEMLHREVAVKEIIPPDWMTDAEQDRLRERTLREARSAARLNHPNVVRIYDVVHAEGLSWIVMEYVHSRSLHQVLNEDGPYDPAVAARIGLAVLDALDAAHRAGVLHRDVKPHNVLIGADDRVVLTDFGLATFVDDGTVTMPGLIVGSPQYVSPERARHGASTVESDLWSLGATLYAAVEGRSPYARETAMATLGALATEPPDPPVRAGPLAPVLGGLLRFDPATRLTVPEIERRLQMIVFGDSREIPFLPGQRDSRRKSSVSPTSSTASRPRSEPDTEGARSSSRSAPRRADERPSPRASRRGGHQVPFAAEPAEAGAALTPVGAPGPGRAAAVPEDPANRPEPARAGVVALPAVALPGTGLERREGSRGTASAAVSAESSGSEHRAGVLLPGGVPGRRDGGPDGTGAVSGTGPAVVAGEVPASGPAASTGSVAEMTDEDATDPLPPGTQEPGKQEPGKQEPGKQEPGTREPGSQALSSQELGTQELGTEEPETTRLSGPAGHELVLVGSVADGSRGGRLPHRFRMPRRSASMRLTQARLAVTAIVVLVIGGSVLAGYAAEVDRSRPQVFVPSPLATHPAEERPVTPATGPAPDAPPPSRTGTAGTAGPSAGTAGPSAGVGGPSAGAEGSPVPSVAGSPTASAVAAPSVTPSAVASPGAPAVEVFSPALCESPAPAGLPVTPVKGAPRGVNGWTLQSGWSYFNDGAGFHLAVPDGWTYQRVGTTYCFRSPRNARVMSFDAGRDAAVDPLVASRAEERRLAASGELAGYALIGIASVPLLHKAADWEYRFRAHGGTIRHGGVRWFAIGDRAYALGWSTPEKNWTPDLAKIQMIRSTFYSIRSAVPR